MTLEIDIRDGPKQSIQTSITGTDASTESNGEIIQVNQHKVILVYPNNEVYNVIFNTTTH